MVRNTLSDLNMYLFEQLERLNDEDLSSDELKEEINRSKAISGISSNIINNANLMLDGQKFIEHTGEKIPDILEVEFKDEKK